MGGNCKSFAYFKNWLVALAGWLTWLEHHPEHQKVLGSIPSQGTYVGCVSDPWSGHVWEAISWFFSLTSKFLSLPSFL